MSTRPRIRVSEHARERWRVRGSRQRLDDFLETAEIIDSFDDVPRWLRHHAIVHGPDYALKPGDHTIAVGLTFDRDLGTWIATSVYSKKMEEDLAGLGRQVRGNMSPGGRRGRRRKRG